MNACMEFVGFITSNISTTGLKILSSFRSKNFLNFRLSSTRWLIKNVQSQRGVCWHKDVYITKILSVKHTEKLCNFAVLNAFRS